MKNRINQLKKNKYSLILVTLTVLAIAVLFFSDYGVVERINLEMKISELKKEIILQKQVSDSMQIIINKIKNDTVEIEKIAREKYGMMKNNEDIYYIKPKN